MYHYRLSFFFVIIKIYVWVQFGKFQESVYRACCYYYVFLVDFFLERDECIFNYRGSDL